MGVSRRTRQKELKKNIYALVIIAIFAILVFSINSVGKFIATKIIQPVVNFTGIKNEKVSTDTLKTQKLTLYLVSAGEMPTQAEAETLKTFVTEQGGGGYIFQEDGVYNVIFAVFSDKKSAEEKGQEIAGDFAPSVITATIEETVIKVTGKASQMEIIHSCFTVLNDIALTLEKITNSVNHGKISTLEASKEIQKLKNRIDEAQTKLEELSSANTKVLAVSDMLVLSQTLLTQLPSSDDSSFKQKLNYTACAYACEFYRFYCSLE